MTCNPSVKFAERRAGHARFSAWQLMRWVQQVERSVGRTDRSPPPPFSSSSLDAVDSATKGLIGLCERQEFFRG